MAPDGTTDELGSDDPSFEAGMREQHELMAAMASREKWDGEPFWVVQGRKLAGGALYAAAIAAVIVILWVASSIFLNS